MSYAYCARLPIRSSLVGPTPPIRVELGTSGLGARTGARIDHPPRRYRRPPAIPRASLSMCQTRCWCHQLTIRLRMRFGPRAPASGSLAHSARELLTIPYVNCLQVSKQECIRVVCAPQCRRPNRRRRRLPDAARSKHTGHAPRDDPTNPGRARPATSQRKLHAPFLHARGIDAPLNRREYSKRVLTHSKNSRGRWGSPRGESRCLAGELVRSLAFCRPATNESPDRGDGSPALGRRDSRLIRHSARLTSRS